jgi:hypothetical protein
MNDTGFTDAAPLLLAVEVEEDDETPSSPPGAPEDDPSYDVLPPAAGFGF